MTFRSRIRSSDSLIRDYPAQVDVHVTVASRQLSSESTSEAQLWNIPFVLAIFGDECKRIPLSYRQCSSSVAPMILSLFITTQIKAQPEDESEYTCYYQYSPDIPSVNHIHLIAFAEASRQHPAFLVTKKPSSNSCSFSLYPCLFLPYPHPWPPLPFSESPLFLFSSVLSFFLHYYPFGYMRPICADLMFMQIICQVWYFMQIICQMCVSLMEISGIFHCTISCWYILLVQTLFMQALHRRTCILDLRFQTYLYSRFLAQLDYVSRAHVIEIRPSSVRPSVRPSVASIISKVIAWISFKF